MSARVLSGDCRDHLELLAIVGDQFDAVITDPPYELGFMGKSWDRAGVAFEPETWGKALAVLKPGAHLCAFGGTRTFHRMAVAIEDAGFEIRDCLMWLYGTGFPKSHNGPWGGTALKPAWEPIIVARKPLIGTLATNVLEHGTGGLNIDECRVPGTDNTTKAWRGAGGRSRDEYRTGTSGKSVPTDLGRWPANVIHDGSDEVEEAFAAFGEKGGAAPPSQTGSATTVNAFGAYRKRSDVFHGDTGTASRFFYCAKASKADRAGSKHPTVKPLALMRWLCTLVTPPGGAILDPFAGSGTTLQAARECGFRVIGIEREPEYVADIRRRLAS